MDVVGAGAILSVGLLRSIEWAKMERRFDVDGGVSGGIALLFFLSAQKTLCLKLVSSAQAWLCLKWIPAVQCKFV